MVFKWRDNHTDKFINLYRGYAYLWDNNSPLYKNREARITAYKEIIKEMNIPELQVRDVKNKIKTVRTNYKSELNKVLRSERKNPGQVYIPHLFWYKKIDSFLRDVYLKKRVGSPDSYSLKDEDESYMNTDDCTQELSEIESRNIKVEDIKFQEQEYVISLQNNSPVDSLVTISNNNIEATPAVDTPNTMPKSTPAFNALESICRILTEDSAASTVNKGRRTSANSHDTIDERIDSRTAKKFNSVIKDREPSAEFMTLERRVDKLERTIDRCREADDDEFDLFGKSIAIQLKRMPLERALTCQENLQKVMIQERLSQNKTAQ